jgi:hypothetical protein
MSLSVSKLLYVAAENRHSAENRHFRIEFYVHIALALITAECFRTINYSDCHFCAKHPFDLQDYTTVFVSARDSACAAFGITLLEFKNNLEAPSWASSRG